MKTLSKMAGVESRWPKENTTNLLHKHSSLACSPTCSTGFVRSIDLILHLSFLQKIVNEEPNQLSDGNSLKKPISPTTGQSCNMVTSKNRMFACLHKRKSYRYCLMKLISFSIGSQLKSDLKSEVLVKSIKGESSKLEPMLRPSKGYLLMPMQMIH